MPERIITLADGENFDNPGGRPGPLGDRGDCLSCDGSKGCCNASAARTPTQLGHAYGRLAGMASEYRAIYGEPSDAAKTALLRASGLSDEWASHPLTYLTMQAQGIADEDLGVFAHGVAQGIRKALRERA